MKAKKSLGQNFLKNEIVLKKIADSFTVREDDLIIEIGPGMGALTKYLVNKKANLICFEIDKSLEDILSKYKSNKTKIVFEDFLLLGLKDIENYPNTYVIANIPYYITTPIIKKCLTITNLRGMCLLVQKEVAQRLCAKPNTKKYGSLTVYLNYYFNIEYLQDVKNTDFVPSPKVDSAVVKFIKKEKTSNTNEDTLFKLIEDSFKLKRKTLKNNLKNYDWLKIDEVLKKHNLSETIRAEQLSLDIFIEIANNL